jgi:hypothetical protein
MTEVAYLVTPKPSEVIEMQRMKIIKAIIVFSFMIGFSYVFHC